MTYPKLQFHSIDAFRFFAFLKVFISHFPYDLDNPVIKFLKQGGGIGVAFFFVLSGFLITYILVNEKFHTGKINAKSFFLRRILRIWPIYFLLLLFLYLVPNWILTNIGYIGSGYHCDWFYSFSFTENYRMIYLDAMPGIVPLGVIWSLCIEEHFYILWFFVILILIYLALGLFSDI
ncbi:MAG: acyltransferase [Bacteroidia bacterium]|nr:acyltransferase [Bacteroidia bacterium]